MNKKLLSVSLLLVGLQSYSQVGIGTLTPNQSAQLDVVSNNKGILIPRLGLTSSTDVSTIQKGNVNSLLVFNTNTQNDVTPGYYYWYNDRWMRIVNDADVVALDKNTTNKSLTVIGADLVLTDSDGNTVSIPLSDINILTSVVKNPDGTYTFKNEAGDIIIIDATDNVVTNIQNQGAIYSEIINIIAAEESLTSMVQDDTTGVITYTPERGTPTTAEVVSADAGNEITVGTDGGAYYKPANTVASISASHTVSADDDTLLIDASGSGLTVTLPAAGDNNGRILILRKMDGSGNIITLSEQVTLANGVTFNQFNVQGTMRIQSNGTNWYKID